MKVILAIVCIYMLSGSSNAIKFPNDVPRCRKGDSHSKCMINSANILLHAYAAGGDRNINLLPLDPLSIPRIYIEQGEESPVNVVLTYTNNTFSGLRDFKFYEIKGFNEKLDGKYEIRFKGPRAELIGPYRVNGRILILPIQGDGISNITVLDADFLVRFNGKATMKNGKTYLKVENLKMSFSLSKMIFNLTNLYKGDKVLGDNTNLFLNQNWLEVFTEIKKSVFSAFGQITENVLNNIFTKVPYDELFQQGP